MKIASDKVIMFIIAAIVIATWMYRVIDHELKNPGESMDYGTEMYDSHLYVVRYNWSGYGQHQMTHSPDCPCHNKGN